MSVGRFYCQIDDHDEDITSAVAAARQRRRPKLVFRGLLKLPKRDRRLFVRCSLGHLNILDES